MSDPVLEVLAGLVEQIVRGNPVPPEAWPEALELQPETIGLHEEGGFLRFAQPPDLLRSQALEAGLPALQIEVMHVVDSTNTRMMQHAADASVAQKLCLAEFQAGGRGRRGRTWLSPYARNLSMTLGAAMSRPLPQLGGLSLVVGLGLASGLEDMGVDGVQVKWPNDVLINGAKVCGILIELVQRSDGCEAVIGMGVNVRLAEQERAQIGQPAADLVSSGVTESRTELTVALIRSVVASLELFETHGFSRFIDIFNDRHLFHGEKCAVTMGAQRVTGEVSGVGEQGELILATASGEQRFHGGEVSLRAEDSSG